MTEGRVGSCAQTSGPEPKCVRAGFSAIGMPTTEGGHQADERGSLAVGLLNVGRLTRWVIAVSCLVTSPLAAQQDSLMQLAVHLLDDGHSDSARAIIHWRLGEVSPEDPAYAEVLFTAGLVYADSDSLAIRYFRQISTEYPSSAWAHRALLMLAEHAYAEGNLLPARRAARRVLQDYPLSEVRAEAALMAGRVELDLGDPESGCPLLALAQIEAGDNTALTEYAALLAELSCNDIPDAWSPDDSSNQRPGARAAPANGQGVVKFAVQVAAAKSVVTANRTMRRLQAMDLKATVFLDTDGLFKVRVGWFSRRSDADTLLQELRARINAGAFIVQSMSH